MPNIALVRLASSLPKGSAERRALLVALQKTAGDEYEYANAAFNLIQDEAEGPLENALKELNKLKDKKYAQKLKGVLSSLSDLRKSLDGDFSND